MNNPVSAFTVYSTSKPKHSNAKSALNNRFKKKKKNKQNKQRNAAFFDKKKNLKSAVRPLVNVVKTSKNTANNKEVKNVPKVAKPEMKSKKSKKRNQNGHIIKEGTINYEQSLAIAKPTEVSFSESLELASRAISPELNSSQEFIEAADDVILSDDSKSSEEFTPVYTDSSEEGLKIFHWLISPFNTEEFLNRIWEKKPLHIARKNPRYYKDIISTPIIDSMLRNENIIFTKNIDITSYADGKRETHNPVGRAHPHVVWDYYLNGCSIRLLNPQTYVPRLHLLNATLQEFFNTFVGANAYLTPPDSQGFAPHYDDIEAFIMQIEGKKHWRIYKPTNDNEVLPRVSSKNFDQEEIGEPILEVTLEAGDLLYFPRGYIHQGVTIDGEHSLHITVSMYQKHSWADLFEKMLPSALQSAITENVELRRGLPFDIYDNFGLVHADSNTPRKYEVRGLVETLFTKIKNYLNIDAAVDEMAKVFQHSALPPVLTNLEKSVTIYDESDMMVENGKVARRVEIELDTRIRLLRKNIIRMVMTEEGIKLYFHTENSLEYQAQELQFMEIDESLAPAIETLVTTYPEYVSVENLEIENESDKIQVANDLWEKGLIMTEFPLEYIDEE